MSFAMAGMWGGMVGGALTGGLDGGWQGALMGAAIGGIGGALGGWAAGGEHYWAMGGMFAAGAGVAGATNSWDSFAGGFTGGLAGWAAGSGITSAYKEQFANYRAGNGFESNRNVHFDKFSQEMKIRHDLNVNQKDSTVEVIRRPLGKDLAGDPGSTTGPRHSAIISDQLENGKWEMGPQGGIVQTTNTADNLDNWGTHIATENSLGLGGRYIESFDVQVNMGALQDNIALYEDNFAGKIPYIATNHNSNFAVNSVVYGAGGDVPEAGWAPGFPDSP